MKPSVSKTLHLRHGDVEQVEMWTDTHTHTHGQALVFGCGLFVKLGVSKRLFHSCLCRNSTGAFPGPGFWIPCPRHANKV